MRIQIVHFSSSPGGIEVLMPHIVNNMPEYEYQAFVIRPPVKNKVNIYDKLLIPVTYGSSLNRKAMLKLFRYAFNHRNDIFYAFNTGPFYLLMLRLAGVQKCVYSIRGTKYWDTPFQKFIRRIIWKLSLADGYRVIGNSFYASKIFTDYLGLATSTVKVNYNPVANANLYLKSSSEENRLKTEIIYAGRLVHGKNLFKWLDVAAQIHKVNANTIFRLYGQGPLKEELEKYAKSLGIADCVSFEGFCFDIATAYRKADLMIFLSEYESFGNVVVESILCGTPVIASPIPSMKEIFENFPDFVIDDTLNIEEKIIEKVRRLHQLQEQALQCEKEFRRRFSIEQHIETLRQLNGSF